MFGFPLNRRILDLGLSKWIGVSDWFSRLSSFIICKPIAVWSLLRSMSRMLLLVKFTPLKQDVQFWPILLFNFYYIF